MATNDVRTLFERPRTVTDLDACRFYHTLELPTSGLQLGYWDLRPGLDRYLPALDYEGRTVLDIGPASGGLTFELERRGADVIAFDVTDGSAVDLVPFHGFDEAALRASARERIEGIKNSFWLAHRELGSSARVVYGHANALPDPIGPVDVAFLGNILQHLRDPLGAVAGAARLARTIVVTEALWFTGGAEDGPALLWLPALHEGAPAADRAWSWWQVNAETLAGWLEMLGFRVTQRYTHEQLLTATGHLIEHYTIVASRP